MIEKGLTAEQIDALPVFAVIGGAGATKPRAFYKNIFGIWISTNYSVYDQSITSYKYLSGEELIKQMPSFRWKVFSLPIADGLYQKVDMYD